MNQPEREDLRKSSMMRLSSAHGRQQMEEEKEECVNWRRRIKKFDNSRRLNTSTNSPPTPTPASSSSKYYGQRLISNTNHHYDDDEEEQENYRSTNHIATAATTTTTTTTTTTNFTTSRKCRRTIPTTPAPATTTTFPPPQPSPSTKRKMTILTNHQSTQQQRPPPMSKLHSLLLSKRRMNNNNNNIQLTSVLIATTLALLVFTLNEHLTQKPLVGLTEASRAHQRAASHQQHQQHHQKQQQQLELLRSSANVELERSNQQQRFQRDTTKPAPMIQLSPTAAGATSTNELVRETAGGQAAPAVCGYPGSPAHASVSFNTSLVVAGTAASYTCDNGYELLGPPRRICQSNGSWSPVGIPFCVLNVGLGKAAMQSSTAGQGSAQKAVDGSTSPYFQASTCTMTDVENNPWWYVNLLEPYLVQIVRIDFGTACCANRQKATIAVRVGNNRPDLGNNPLCNRYHGFIEEGKPLFLPCTRPAPGAFVSIHLESPSGSSLSICETFIYTDHALSIEQCPSFRDQPLGSTATYNGKCYLFHNNQALTFDQARKYCDSRGGSLVDETSPALQGFLSWELYRRHRNDQLMGQYWLGALKDARNPNNWKWINGKDVQISFWNSMPSPAAAGTTSPAATGGANGNLVGGNCSRFDGSKGWLWSSTDCSSQLNFICQYRPLSCGKPEKPTNSTLTTKNIDNGTVIEYQCAPGNMLMGPKSRACLPTGFFSEFAPKCKYLDCQFPAQIPMGDYKLLNGTTSYQSVVNYFCQEGYQLYGKSTLTCDVDERWNGPPPRCEPLLCPAPVPPSNGYVTLTANVTLPGTQATYDCRPGYELVGDQLLTCSISGSWDNSFPFCREKRMILPHATLPTHLVVATPPSAGTPTAQVAGGGAKPSIRTNPSASMPSHMSNVPTAQPPQPPQPPPTTTTTKPNQGGGVVFPQGSNVASSRPITAPMANNNGQQAMTTTTSATAASTSSITTTSTSLPASLNGLTSFAPTTFTSNNNNNNNAGGHMTITSAGGQAANSIEQQQHSTAHQQDQGGASANQEQQNRKPSSQSSSVNQFIVAPPPPPSSAAPTQPAADGGMGLLPAQVNQQQVRTRPQQVNQQLATGSTPSIFLDTTTTSNNNNRQQQQQQQSQAISSNKFTFNTAPPPPTQPTLNPSSSSASGSSGHGFGESTPLATTNSVSVHGASSSSSAQATGGGVTSTAATNQHSTVQLLNPSIAPTTSSTTSNILSTPPSGHLHAHLQSSGHHQQQQNVFNNNNQQQQHQQNVLASLSSAGRPAHNMMSNAKYSLDGIIAVAIFGGFIFLGAIITIIVIIIRRRKSGHSSSIDAQTISTYDSNGERNGLYRNYQQAWENLRFASPNSQPKSSGANDVVLMGAHVVGAPSVGLKNFASPMGVVSAGNLHHQHHMHHQQHSIMHNGTGAAALGGGGGHHNLAMSAGSSSSSSSLGGALTSAGVDPLLRGHSLHHQQHLQAAQQAQQLSSRRASSQQHQHRHSNELSEDDDDDDDEGDDDLELNSPGGGIQNHYHPEDGNGIMNTNELGNDRRSRSSFRTGAGGDAGGGEGFRDSDELTIGADQVVNSRGISNHQQHQHQQQQARRSRLYSTNSMGRRSTCAAPPPNSNRLSGNLSTTMNDNHNHHSHHHHHHHHHQQQHHANVSSSSNGSSAHQRLVSSSTTPTTSSRSSRASPPTDEHSLEQLAYGNSWHPNGGAGGHGGSNQSAGSQQDSTSGSGASMLGAESSGRLNMRY